MRPSGRRRMFVTLTGRPPPSCDLLDGTVLGVNESLALLGYGVASSSARASADERGPADSAPCDSSSVGWLLTTRQISRPSAGRLSSNPFLLRFSSRRYSLPSSLTSTLKHSFALPSTGDRMSFCFTVGSITVGLTQPSCSFDHA